MDDCSTDNTVDIIKSFKDERIKLFQNEVNSVKCGNVVNVKILNVTGVDLDSRFVSLRKEFTANSKVSFIN